MCGLSAQMALGIGHAGYHQNAGAFSGFDQIRKKIQAVLAAEN